MGSFSEYVQQQNSTLTTPTITPITEEEDKEEQKSGNSFSSFITSKPKRETVIEDKKPVEVNPEQDARFTEYYSSRQEPVPEGVVAFDESIRLEEVDPEEDDRFVEYYSSRMLPVPDTAVPYYDYQNEERTRLEDVRAEQEAAEEYFDSLSDEEFASFADEIRKDLRKGTDIRGADPITVALSYLPAKTLMGLGNAVMKLDAWSRDNVEIALESIKKESPVVFKGIDMVVAGGRYSETDDPTKLADRIMNNFGAVGEFLETVPAIGSIRNSFSSLQLKNFRKIRQAYRDQKTLETAQRYNPGGAQLATMEASEEARLAAKKIADQEIEVTSQMIREFEEKTGRTISKKVNGNLVYDPDAAREAGRETARQLSEKDGALFDLAITGDTIVSPMLDPDKFNGIVATAVEFKKLHPEIFDNKKPLIDNLIELTVRKDLNTKIGGEVLIDTLNKYGLSFEDYVLTVVGSGSDFGRGLQMIGQIKRKKPAGVKAEEELQRAAREAGDFNKSVRRLEGVRRGGLVSQIATASRNLSSAAIRSPLESLGNIVDNVLYEFDQPIRGGVTDASGGFLGAGRALISGDNWRNSFSNFKYMFARPDVAKGYTDLILSRKELATQYSRMFDNINEIQKATGKGSGTNFDKVMTEMEDVVDTLNVPNRWQEYLIRRGTFFSELERLTKREYGIDLIDALNDGKLNDLLNDASSVRPEKARSFISIIDDSVNRALDVTYAKQPDLAPLRELSTWITRNNLTVVVPFPRFMFNSMELMGQYAGGASLPLTRKVANLVGIGKGGPLTAKERQRISRNLMGMAAVGAAYMYRTSENALVDPAQIAVGDDAQMDTTATYPMAQFNYLGDQVKNIVNGTFGDKFDYQEFIEMFTGSNFRTGVGNSIFEEVAQIADGTDLISGEAAGRAIGRTLGNYLRTWAVPLAQIIDMQRATGTRGTDFKDTSVDPTLDIYGTAMNEAKQVFLRSGIGLSAEEEAELPKREYPLYPEGRKRLMPHLKPFGVTITNRPPEDSEYLMKLGLDWSIGSRSKVPSIAAFENKMINGYLEILANISRNRELELRKDYKNASDKVKETFTEQQYVLNELKPFAKAQLDKFKKQIREGAIAQGDEYARALTKYRRVRPDYRKLATIKFTEMYDRDPDAMSAGDLNRLILIAKEYRSAYSQ